MSTPPTLLIVDDAPQNLGVLAEVLQPYYRVRAATSGAQALAIAGSTPPPDLILLDVMMPEMDGHEVLARLRAAQATAAIPVVFVTALAGAEDELHGLEDGAVDYIAKPIVPALLLARVRNQLELKQARDRLTDQNAWLEAEVARRMRENERIQQVAIRALARLAETRDPETGNHILRTQGYVELLARRLETHPRFASALASTGIPQLAASAPLHDIGKVGIPDAILNKPGPLTSEEWVVMKTHARLGAEAIEAAAADGGDEPGFLAVACEIAHWHHEKWDGSGYPDGLAGEAIPVSARLMALADVFDALISRRCYKPPMPPEEARRIIADGRGRHFDPDVVDAFDSAFDQFLAIARAHSDDD